MEFTQDMTVQLTVRVSKVDIEQIETLVRSGYAINTADFLRQALREKISHIEKAVA